LNLSTNTYNHPSEVINLRFLLFDVIIARTSR
jgi:hypothetical protein